MTPTDKSQRVWTIVNTETGYACFVGQSIAQGESVHVIEHSAYLAVKEELDKANYDANEQEFQALTWKASYESLKQELEAARAEIELYKGCQFTWEQTRRTEIMVRQQLADAKAQIKDYESALETILNEGNMAAQGHWDATDKMKTIAFKTLNKWRAK